MKGVGRIVGAALWLAASAGACAGQAAPPSAPPSGHPSAPLSARDLADRVEACALLHLTGQGYAGLRGRAAWPEVLTRRSLRDLSRHALRRSPPLGLRNSLPLQWQAGSSIEASGVYRTLDVLMADAGLSAHQGLLSRDVATLARKAHRLRAARDGVGRCILFKWGNKRPDLFFAPLPASELDRIRALFSDAAYARFRTDFAGRRWPHGLTPREAFELRALRLAHFRFELNFEMLDRDAGGFQGNLRGEIGGTVCTDEAAIHEAFLRQVVVPEGLLTRFALIAPAQFAHRRPQPRLTGPLGGITQRVNDVYGLTDHFAPVLRRRSGPPLTLVLDAWVEDGGLPPHIATYDDWMARREAANLVPLFADAGLLHDARLDRRALAATGRPVRLRHGLPAYDALRRALVRAHFAGHWPVPQPDPRSFDLRAEMNRWTATDGFGR